MLLLVFMESKLSIRYVNRTTYTKKRLETRHGISLIERAMSHPSSLEIKLYFDSLLLLEESMQSKAGVHGPM